MKHTTVKKDNPFNLSELKETFQGFAARFKANEKDNIEFILVTNRAINANLKSFIKNVISGNKYNELYMKTFKKYTGLVQK